MDGFQVSEWQESTMNDENATGASVPVSGSVSEESTEKIATETKTLTEDAIEENSVVDSPEEKAEDSSGEQSNDESQDVSLALLKELNEKVDQMNLLFKQKIQHTSHEEKIVDQMHAELQKYKDDMYAQLVRPILLDIIEIRDSIRRVSENFASKPEEERVVPLKTFSDYTFDIQDVLEKNNITIYDSRDGDDFNALKHRALKKVTTPVEELHGKIAESLSSGYEYLGKTISPEKVVVYIYQKPENTEGEN